MGNLLLRRKMEYVCSMENIGKTKNRERIGLLVLLGCLFSLSVWAQTDVICGTVTDAKYKERLIDISTKENVTDDFFNVGFNVGEGFLPDGPRRDAVQDA